MFAGGTNHRQRAEHFKPHQERRANPRREPDKTIEEQVKRYMLSLRVDGKECSLLVKEAGHTDRKTEQLKLGIAPPCEFVRTGDKVLSYSYGEAGNWRDVVMFVGGPPYADRKDFRMPNGCGSEFQAVNLYADKVVVGPKIGNERGIFLACPSTGGLDEIYFSEYSLPSRSK